MKMNKRKIAVVSLVLCIVATASLGSLSWFTATDTIENTLRFVTNFEMDLYETDEDGNIILDFNGKSIGQNYENLTPGSTLHKDPTVINKSNTEAQYIRVSVTIDKANAWKTVVPEGSELTDIFSNLDATKWTRYDDGIDDLLENTVTYTFYLNNPLEAGQSVKLFTGVTIPIGLTKEQAMGIGESHIVIKADAIQYSNLEGVGNARLAFALVEGD